MGLLLSMDEYLRKKGDAAAELTYKIPASCSVAQCSDADYGTESSGSNTHLLRILSHNPGSSILTGGIELQSLSVVIT